VDLNHRPPGPEPDSSTFKTLLNCVGSICFGLNPLVAPFGILGSFVDPGGSDSDKVVYALVRWNSVSIGTLTISLNRKDCVGGTRLHPRLATLLVEPVVKGAHISVHE
jgi:hypothetical protein